MPGPESMLALGEREPAWRRRSAGSSAGERRSTMLERQSRLDRALLCSAPYPAAGDGGVERYSGVPRCPPQVPRAAGRPPPDPSPPRAGLLRNLRGCGGRFKGPGPWQQQRAPQNRHQARAAPELLLGPLK